MKSRLGTFYKKYWGFPGGAVDKNPPANAGDVEFEPWSGEIPTCHGATKPVCLNY